ncbi:hypothetical protein B0H16DRAFT_1479163 [Mycena metata]|uniref:RING-type domain-containing protein n=1 Tax=Mycena metata TaxID=1033252 RepID=A0AAD7MDQ7_9AGAR|nr:hypothetical protein B0H16DRAFT_1479163 [Mycena metata]
MAATFSPSPAELVLTQQIFVHVDPQKLGALTGEVAIWEIADESNNGWLPQKGVAMAVRLMGHAQKGEKVSAALFSKPGPLPTITGITPVVAQGTGASASRARSPQPVSGLPPFTPQDKAKFQSMFLKSSPVDGLLSGEKAKEVFIKSKLPNETLGLIWYSWFSDTNLADTQDRGRLDSTDFAIGMYLIQATMTGQLQSIPSALPPGFYQQVAGGAAGSIRCQATGGSFSPLASSFSQTQTRSNIQPQYTGASQHLLQPQATGPWFAKPPVPPHLPARPSQSAPGSSPSAIGTGAFGAPQLPWDVTPAEKASADRWFDSLDTQKRGFIQDDVAVPFMLESKLSGDDLAQIWDLADMNNDGRLTRDGFAIAWYLIQKKRNGVPIPSSLPQSLIPPSMRGPASASPVSPAASAFAPAPPPPEPAKDGVKRFREMLSHLQSLPNDYAAVIITRPPEIITCFRVPIASASGKQDAFIVFDSHPRTEHPNGAGLIINTSLDATAAHLDKLLAVDGRLLTDSSLQWQTQLLANFSGHFFVPRGSATNSVEELTRGVLESSLVALSLQAEVAELKFQNSSLSRDRQALEKELDELKDKYRSVTAVKQRLEDGQRSPPPSPKNTRRQDSSKLPTSGPSSTPKDDHSMDEGYMVAMQLQMDWGRARRDDDLKVRQKQREFEEEDARLTAERAALQKYVQPIFECGVCFDKYPEDYVSRVADCSHGFCRDCMKGYVISKLKDKLYPIFCPMCVTDNARAEPGSELIPFYPSPLTTWPHSGNGRSTVDFSITHSSPFGLRVMGYKELWVITTPFGGEMMVWDNPRAMGYNPVWVITAMVRFAFKAFGDQVFAKLPGPETYGELTGRTYIVTGSNTGIGLGLATHLASLRPAQLILAVRDLKKGEAAKGTILKQTDYKGSLEVWQLDMADFASVKRFAERAKADLKRLDGVDLNAGIHVWEWGTTVDGWERTASVAAPASGHDETRPPAPRCIEDGAASDNYWFRGYAKLSSVLSFIAHRLHQLFSLYLTREIANLPQAKGVIVNVVDPGLCTSELARDLPLSPTGLWLFQKIGWPPAKGALNLLYALLHPTSQGAYVTACAEYPTPAWTLTKKGLDLQAKFWSEMVEVWKGVAPEVSSVLV